MPTNPKTSLTLLAALTGIGTWLAATTPAKAEPPKELQAEVLRCYQSRNKLVFISETKTLKLTLTPEQKKKLEAKRREELKAKLLGGPGGAAAAPAARKTAIIVPAPAWTTSDAKNGKIWTKTTVVGH